MHPHFSVSSNIWALRHALHKTSVLHSILPNIPRLTCCLILGNLGTQQRRDGLSILKGCSYIFYLICAFGSHVTWNSAVPDPNVWCCVLLFLCTLDTMHTRWLQQEEPVWKDWRQWRRRTRTCTLLETTDSLTGSTNAKLSISFTPLRPIYLTVVLRCSETLSISHENANILFSVFRMVQGEAKTPKIMWCCRANFAFLPAQKIGTFHGQRGMKRGAAEKMRVLRRAWSKKKLHAQITMISKKKGLFSWISWWSARAFFLDQARRDTRIFSAAPRFIPRWPCTFRGKSTLQWVFKTSLFVRLAVYFLINQQ